MAARKILVIDAPIFLMVDAEADPEDVAADFDEGLQTQLEGFNGFGSYDPLIIDAGVRTIDVATKEELDRRGIEIEGDEPE